MTLATRNCSKYSIAIFKSEITSWILLPQSSNLPIFKTYIGCVIITFRCPFFWLTCDSVVAMHKQLSQRSPICVNCLMIHTEAIRNGMCITVSLARSLSSTFLACIVIELATECGLRFQYQPTNGWHIFGCDRGVIMFICIHSCYH